MECKYSIWNKRNNTQGHIRHNEIPSVRLLNTIWGLVELSFHITNGFSNTNQRKIILIEMILVYFAMCLTLKLNYDKRMY